MKIKKGLIIEISLIIVFIALAVLMYNLDFYLILFEFYTTKSLEDKKIELEQAMSDLEQQRQLHKSSLTALETAKTNYASEKERYEAISEETISTINNATQGEEYNLDYMWITVGNYAKKNNLSIILYEPEASVGGATAPTEDTSTTDEKNTGASTSNGTVDSNLAARSTENFRIKVVGTYTNISEFIYDVESDPELRFNLDNIRMEYSGKDNNIAAIFEVKDLVFNK